MASTKSREVIWGGRIRAAKMNANPLASAPRSAREADRAEAEALGLWRMEGYGGQRSRLQPSSMYQGGLGWLEVECNRCKTRVVCRSVRSAVRVTRRFGNTKLPMPQHLLESSAWLAMSSQCRASWML